MRANDKVIISPQMSLRSRPQSKGESFDGQRLIVGRLPLFACLCMACLVRARLERRGRRIGFREAFGRVVFGEREGALHQGSRDVVIETPLLHRREIDPRELGTGENSCGLRDVLRRLREMQSERGYRPTRDVNGRKVDFDVDGLGDGDVDGADLTHFGLLSARRPLWTAAADNRTLP